MSSPAPAADGRDMLHRLPDELLIGVLELSPSFSALWSLINTSLRLAAVFRSYATQITEAVLQTTLPQQTQGLVKAVLQLRSSCLPCSLAQAQDAPSTRSGRPIDAVAPGTARGIVLLAHRIRILAHECVGHYIRSCTSMSAEELADPALIASGVGAHQELGWKRPAGRTQRLPDTGAPLAAEEQLVAMNLWRLQYFFEVRAAFDAGRFEWSATDCEAMLRLSVPRFHHLSIKSYKREQLQAVTRYVVAALEQQQQQHGRGSEVPVGLPRPTAAHPFDIACAPPKRVAPRLEFKPRGWGFVTSIPGENNYSPLYGVTLAAYRKYGFAVFHDTRMVELGLLPP